MTLGFRVEKTAGTGHLRLLGKLDIYHSETARRTLEKELGMGSDPAILDVAELTKLDTVGALLLRHLQEKNKLEIQYLKPEHIRIFKFVAQMKLEPYPTVKRQATSVQFLEDVGKQTLFAGKWIIEITAFLGQACSVFIRAIVSPKHLRFADIMHHIEETGIQALPIIGVIAFMISVVLAYQGIAQLRPLGAESLTVNLVAISVLREMGVLLTAIMVAGRSGSAFAAEIGVMKLREEVDALRVIGIDPFEVLVMPRLIALIITLPLLTFIADIMGLFGGGIMSMMLIDLPLGAYMERVRAVAHGDDFLVGMIKAPVFAFMIAMVGCLHGLKVSGSAESVGQQTTAAVVKGIFLVLVFDALFSVLFEKMGL